MPSNNAAQPAIRAVGEDSTSPAETVNENYPAPAQIDGAKEYNTASAVTETDNGDNTAPVQIDAGKGTGLECIYYNEDNFYASVKGNESSCAAGNKIILGGIVTHHLLASGLMARFFSEISAEKPETVIVIGPNHKRYGTSLVHTGTWEWDAAFGTVGVDLKVEAEIVKEFGAHEDYKLLMTEHSVSSLVPYISYYMPGVKIVPVLLNGNLGMDGCIKMTDMLESAFLEKKCLLVSSIDFSHYLAPEKAYEMDEATMRAIRDRDYEKIMRMGNDNLDTPPALVITLMLMDRLGADEDVLLAHRNSSDITGIRSDSTTSYLTYLFRK